MKVSNNPKIYFWANLIGNISFLAPVMTLFYFHRGLGFPDIFNILIIIVATMFLFEVPTGVFADKYGSRASLIFGQILTVLISIAYAFAQGQIVWYLIAFFIGIAVTFFSGCDEALIYDSLKESRKEKTMSVVWGKIQSATHLPAIFAIILGAIIAKDLLEWQFLILVGLGVLVGIVKLVLILFIKNPKKQYSEINQPVNFKNFFEGIKIIKKYPKLLLLFMNETLVLIPIHVFNNFYQPYFLESGISVEFFGIIAGLGSALMYFALNKINWLEKRMIRTDITYLTGLGIFLAYVVAAFTRSVFLAILVYFVIRTFTHLRLPVFSQIKNSYIPSKFRATTLSTLSMIDSFFDILIFVGLGIISSLGLTWILAGSAMVVLIGLFFPIFEKRN